jgi:hypothetical protein
METSIGTTGNRIDFTQVPMKSRGTIAVVVVFSVCILTDGLRIDLVLILPTFSES